MSRLFDGVDDVVTCGSGSSVTDLTPITACAWINPVSEGEGGKGRIFNKLSGPNGWSFYMGETSTNALVFTRNLTGGLLYRVSNDNVYTLNAWNFVAVTWSGGTTQASINMYVNGSEVSGYQTGADSSGTLISESGGNLLVGNNDAASRTFDGKISHAMIFNSVLGLGEIKQLMMFPGSITRTMKFYMPLHGASTEPDYSGNRNNGTVTGATVSSNDPPINNVFYPRKSELMYAYTAPAGGGGTFTNIGPHVLLDRWRRVA